MSALAHLRAADPVLAALIDELEGHVETIEVRRDRRPADYYAGLVRTIVGQQLSTRVAQAIWLRVLDYFDGELPTPAMILAADPDELRAAGGLSRAKTGYLRSLAEHVQSGALELERLEQLDDETVLSELVAVKGLGEWSAHMFLMFQLGRPDVLAPGDLGIRKGIQLVYGLVELPKPTEVIARAEPWRPYRTTACLYLWGALDARPLREQQA
ncbi:MAG: DNA-3-methyladenine glycosylase 2 family protein [Solirubrobacteraceae bacterium]|jgi:DNA-3-methyladenine glycosylase II